MLKDQLTQYINKLLANHPSQIELYKEEKEFVEKFQLVEAGITIVEKDENSRFLDAYIERTDKEFENLIAEESDEFLQERVKFLKQHQSEFIYLESDWFTIIGVDAISLEVDDLFGTYEALLGLKLQKKYETVIRDYLKSELKGDTAKFALLFNQEDGLWNLNISLNNIDGFQEDISVGEAYSLVYHFLFKLGEAVEENDLCQ